MVEHEYSMVQECTTRYEARSKEDGTLEIHISVPPRFADLWIVKLSGLRTNDAEIREFEPQGE